MLPEDTTHGERTDVQVAVEGPAGGETDALAATVDGERLLLVGAGDLDHGRYRVSGAVAYDPRVVARVTDWLSREDPRCPDCEGPLAYDAPAALAGVDRTVDERDLLDGLDRTRQALGVLDAGDATVERLGADSVAVDDWQGQPNDGFDAGVDVWSLHVEVRCEDCGERFDLAERERDEFRDEDARGDDLGGLVDHALDSAPDASGRAVGGQAMATQQSLDTSRNLASSPDPSAAAEADLGMATGGAKDAANFRDNVAEGYVPLPHALSHEGLFYDYYFDTGDAGPPGGEDDEALFYPSYAAAVTEDPLTGETERYLTVGLNSTLTTADFERKRLNLVAVLDVSGSMSSQFSEYYYDRHGRECEADAGEETKMAAAREALAALTTHLEADDRLGVVLYNSRAHVAKPLRDVGSTDMDAIRGHIRELRAGGGTDLSAGFRAGRELLADVDADPTDVENRVVFLTDMMPNLGELEEGGLVDLFADAAADGVHTTFVGMGLDANADLADALSGIRGANHYFVHSADEFEQRLADEFEYMVTPLVYDLSLDVVGDGYELAGVFGSPDADAATGEVMHVSTLFPSPTREGETRGGVVLLELEETGTDPTLELVASWVERDGSEHRDAVTVEFPADRPEHFENTGVRKAVLLTRYAELLRDWSASVHDAEELDDELDDDEAELVDDWEGGVDDWQEPDPDELSEWEHGSVPLVVTEEYAELFERFRAHLRDEMDVLGDEDLQQEVEVLDELIEAARE